MRTGKEAHADVVPSMTLGRSGSNHTRMPTLQQLTQDGGRDQPSRLGAALLGSNHIVVGSFGDPRPMMVGITSARKNSPRSQRKNLESKAGRRFPGGVQLPGLSNGSNQGDHFDTSQFVGA